jgi:signal transduction histidine kinase
MNNHKTILVVDDEQLLRETYIEHLTEAGYSTLEACTGNQAVRGLDNHEVDAVLCDYHMHDGEGHVVLKRANELNIPVIMLSSMTQKNLVIGLINLKPFHFIDKSEGLAPILPNVEKAVEFRHKFLESQMYMKIGEKSAQMIHDINNPLNIITGGLEIIKSNKADAKIIETTLERIDQSAKRISNLIKETKMRVKDEGIVTYPEVSIVEFFKSIVEDQMILSLKSNTVIHFYNHLPSDIPVRLNENDLRRVFANLIENSLYAFQDGKNYKREIFIELSMGDFKQLKIRYKDFGPGIKDEIKNKLFVERITTKPAGVGSGLGLEGCAEIIEDHLGSIVAGDCSDGAEFIISLPLSSEVLTKLAG